MRQTVSRYFSLLLLAVIASSPLACATKEKPKAKTAQQLQEEAAQKARLTELAKVVLDYLSTPEKQEKQYAVFISRMLQRAKASPESSEVNVAFTSAGEMQFGHYDLTTKALTMGDPAPEVPISRIYLSLGDIRFIKCAVNGKRIDMSATKTESGEYKLKMIGSWDVE